MKRQGHKKDGQNRPQNARYHLFVFAGKERGEEKEGSGGPFASERGDEPRSGIPNGSAYSCTYFGARYMDHELMTMWLSVDPMADKYPSISPYAYCAWNPVLLIDPDGMRFDSIGQLEVNKLKRNVISNMYKGGVMSALYREEYKSTLAEIYRKNGVTYKAGVIVTKQ